MKTIQDFESDEAFIRWLFRDRCIICWAQAEVIHEIEPRSSGQDSMNWKNRITLCDNHHKDIHHAGVGDKVIERLKNLRMMFLIMVGRNTYV